MKKIPTLFVMSRWHRFLCRIGWHKIVSTDFDGCSVHAKCSRCGKVGMIDSQGNLF